MHVTMRTKPRFERQSDTIYYSTVNATFVRAAAIVLGPYLILLTKNHTKPTVNSIVAATGTIRLIHARRESCRSARANATINNTSAVATPHKKVTA
jgi:hypothetical protein